MLRNTLKRACGFGLALRVLCMPWLLLLARIWFGQVVFVHQIMTMAEGPHGGLFSGALRVPSGLDAALHSADQTVRIHPRVFGQYYASIPGLSDFAGRI